MNFITIKKEKNNSNDNLGKGLDVSTVCFILPTYKDKSRSRYKDSASTNDAGAELSGARILILNIVRGLTVTQCCLGFFLLVARWLQQLLELCPLRAGNRGQRRAENFSSHVSPFLSGGKPFLVAPGTLPL